MSTLAETEANMSSTLIVLFDLIAISGGTCCNFLYTGLVVVWKKEKGNKEGLQINLYCGNERFCRYVMLLVPFRKEKQTSRYKIKKAHNIFDGCLRDCTDIDI